MSRAEFCRQYNLRSKTFANWLKQHHHATTPSSTIDDYTYLRNSTVKPRKTISASTTISLVCSLTNGLHVEIDVADLTMLPMILERLSNAT